MESSYLGRVPDQPYSFKGNGAGEAGSIAPKYSVVINCYNTLPLIKKCLDQALKTTDRRTEIILVNNHPPYPDVMSFLKRLKNSRIRVVDPGRNLGCSLGFQFGARHARGQYLVKLDDDTIVPDKNWTCAMAEALNDFPDLAYVGLIVPMYWINRFHQVHKPNYVLEFYDDLVHFACIMIKRHLWQAHFQMADAGLYWGDEHFFQEQAQKLGMRKGYLISHVCQHLARTPEADPLFGAWKIFNLTGLAKEEFSIWRKTFKLTPEEEQVLHDLHYPEDQINILKRY